VILDAVSPPTADFPCVIPFFISSKRYARDRFLSGDLSGSPDFLRLVVPSSTYFFSPRNRVYVGPPPPLAGDSHSRHDFLKYCPSHLLLYQAACFFLRRILLPEIALSGSPTPSPVWASSGFRPMRATWRNSSLIFPTTSLIRVLA